MAHFTAIPAASQSAKATSGWFTFLSSAFIDGLKVYGASLMIVSPADHLGAQRISTGPATIVRSTAAARAAEPAIRQHALPRTTLPTPAWRHA